MYHHTSCQELVIALSSQTPSDFSFSSRPYLLHQISSIFVIRIYTTMAASRSASVRALKQLSSSVSRTQTRGLRITPHPEASPYLTTQKPSLARVQVAIDDAAAEAAKAAAIPNTRQFNTSRSLKAVNDSSTIDFAYLPDFDPDAGVSAGPTVRVPLLPESLYPQSTKTSYTKEEQEIVSCPQFRIN